MAWRLAIIEDNTDLLNELITYLDYRGYEVWGVCSAETFWRKLHRHPVDIILIDIGLPGEDGHSVLNYLHELGRYGLIVLTARGQQFDKLHSLSLGADKYLVKPVNFSHLADTIEALGQRLQRDKEAQVPTERMTTMSPTLPVSWRLEDGKLISPTGLYLELTPQEYRLVDRLMRELNQVCSKVELHEFLFYSTSEDEPELHRVDVVISRLRLKARQEGIHLPIRTIFGKGIVFVA
ncbi:response regulator transcription factor [Klebsiella variicola]|uniref:response regulator transcription factor n=1 Tax=Klebsiella variicola TaxID=244366 RepID=UPI000D744DAB|nr:response regulator transcription factor [Klebsiella variicola]PXK73551.1 DNA-binding response regulator [Klebsiella variicola]